MQSSRRPNNPPGFPPGPPGPPPGKPQGGGGKNKNKNVPPGPPPNIVPNEANATKVGGPGMGPAMGAGPGGVVKAVDPGAIAPCLYQYSYIWLNGGMGFWAYITYVGRNSIAGWRYTWRGWQYFGMDTRRIRSFICY